MTNYSESNFSDPSHGDQAGAAPAGQLSWSWLQDRVSQTATAELDVWLEDQLIELELLFDDFVTHKSRSQAIRRQIGDERR